jgi:phosphate transport system ATP-binding protein
MSHNSPAIELKNFSAYFSGKQTLDDINYEFDCNKITAIIGPSGSGKSTLLKTLCRLNDRVDGFSVQGEALVNGKNIYSAGIDLYKLRKQVGLIFQKPCMFPKSIFENVLFGVERSRLSHGNSEDICKKALQEACLWDEVKDRLKQKAPTLSQGQQQRLAIARTLAVEPEILLMDEPTSSLDPKTSRGIEDLILSLKKKHTIILVTHNMDQAKRVADDMICICDGKLYDTGTFEDRNDPALLEKVLENHPSSSEFSKLRKIAKPHKAKP